MKELVFSIWGDFLAESSELAAVCASMDTYLQNCFPPKRESSKFAGVLQPESKIEELQSEE